MFVAGLQVYPPVSCRHLRDIHLRRLLQLVDGLRQAHRQLRQLPLHQCQQAFAVLGRGDICRREQGLHRLQNVLHVMRQARAGVVDRLAVGLLAQGLLAHLGGVEITQQLRQQAHVQGQCRGQRTRAVPVEREPVKAVVHPVRRRLAETPRATRRAPFAATDPVEFVQVGERVAHEGFRIALALGKRRQPLRPAFERQAYGQQIARGHLPQAGETRAWIPQPGQRQQQHRHAEERLHQRPGITRLRYRHHGEHAQCQHDHQQREHQAVDEIQRRRRSHPPRRRQEQHGKRQHWQTVAHGGADFRG